MPAKRCLPCVGRGRAAPQKMQEVYQNEDHICRQTHERSGGHEAFA